MAATRKRRVTHKRRVTRPKKVAVRKPPRAASSRFRAHRGRSASSLFRAHKGRHATAFRTHGKRRLAAHVKHPKAVIVRARKPRAAKKPGATVASHRCGQPLHHTTRHVSVATRKKLSHSLRAKHTHLSKSEKARISKALTGHHATCACKTAGAKKHKARSHHPLSKKTRAKIAATLHKEHADAKWGKAAKGWHKAATAKARVSVLKTAKSSSGRSKAAAKKPC